MSPANLPAVSTHQLSSLVPTPNNHPHPRLRVPTARRSHFTHTSARGSSSTDPPDRAPAPGAPHPGCTHPASRPTLPTAQRLRPPHLAPRRAAHGAGPTPPRPLSLKPHPGARPSLSAASGGEGNHRTPGPAPRGVRRRTTAALARPQRGCGPRRYLPSSWSSMPGAQPRPPTGLLSPDAPNRPLPPSPQRYNRPAGQTRVT